MTPSDVLDRGFWRWFEPWFVGFRAGQEFIVLLVAGALAIYRLARPRARRTAPTSVATAAALMSLVLWFGGAPDVRFGGGLFWILLAVVAAPPLAQRMRERRGRFVALALGLVLVQWFGELSAKLPYAGYGLRLPPVPPQRMREPVELSPGLVVGVPADPSDRCGNEPLPCTPYPAHQRLRRPGELGSGFLY